MDKLRKCVALLSVLLLLSAVRCMASCIVSDAGVPPCHKHQAPVKTCTNQSEGLGLAASLESLQAPVATGPVVYERRLEEPGLLGFVSAGDSWPVHRPPSLSSLVLRI